MYNRGPGTAGPGGAPRGAANGPEPSSVSAGRLGTPAFRYNARVAAALLPAVAVVLGAGGLPVAGTLVVGLTVSYVLDALRLPRGAFLGIWATLFAAGGAAFLTGVGFGPHVPYPLSALVLLTCMHLVFLVGVWASLQFRWLQLEQPAVGLALERILFACSPFTSAAIQTWGIVSALGIGQAPFCLLPILFALYWLLGLPQESSFRSGSRQLRSLGGHLSEETYILGPLEACLHTCLLLFLPTFFHFAVHHSLVLNSANEVCDNLLLFFLPLLFQLYASTRGALWWLSTDPRGLHQVRLVNGAIALIVILACIEVRVIFTSFGHYITLPQPFNYLLVSVALFGGGLGAAAHIMGILKGTASRAVVTAVLLASAVSAALVLGMPWKFLAAPALAAAYLAHFYSSDSPLSYLIFLVGTALSFSWFVVSNFWLLETSVGGMPLREVCMLLLASLVLAMAVPGVALFPRAQVFLGGVFVVQAVLVCRLEDQFYNQDREDEGLYPSYLVVLTTVAGFLAARRLQADQKLGPYAAWAASCLYFAKLALLLVPSPNVVWEATGLLLAGTAPLLLYKDRAQGGVKMRPAQGVAHAAAVFIAVWLARNFVFDALSAFSDHRPSHAQLLGVLLFAGGAACIPIITQHFPHVQGARRALVTLAAAAMLLLVLQPPVPTLGQYLWDASHAPEEDPDDSAIYSTATPWQHALSTWALVLCLMGVVQHLVSGVANTATQSPLLRLGFALFVGTFAGLYLGEEYFSHFLVTRLLLIIATCLLAVFLSFTQQPSASSPHLMPGLFAALWTLLPAMYLAQGLGLKTVEMDFDGQETLHHLDDIAAQDGRSLLIGIYFAAMLLISLVIKLKLGALVSEKRKGSFAGKEGLPHHSPFDPKHRAIQRKTGFMKPFSVSKIAAEGNWMPIVGNIATLGAFVLALFLNSEFTQGSDHSIFAIAPILLLLNQDSSILASFGDRQRYFPLTSVVSIFLIVSVGNRIVEEAWYNYAPDGGQLSNPSQLLWLLKNAVLLALTIPNHAFFNRFMWDYARQSEYLLMLITPLNLPALLMPDIPTIRVLAGLGVAFALVQYVISRQVRIAGMKVI